MLKWLSHIPAVRTSLCVIVTGPIQLSVATTALSLAAGASDAQLTVTSAGMLLITGAILSFTVMVCVLDELLPHASVAVYVRAMLKRLSQLPAVLTSLWVIVTGPAQLSVATTALSSAAGAALAQLTVISAGILAITGAVWSFTVMVWVFVDVLPHASVAV